jgi:hypothetical protein
MFAIDGVAGLAILIPAFTLEVSSLVHNFHRHLIVAYSQPVCPISRFTDVYCQLSVTLALTVVHVPISCARAPVELGASQVALGWP